METNTTPAPARKRRRRPPTHPYPGLRPFEYEENLIFFGREGQVDALINRMRQHHFLAVLGSSGSGKSSLVRAGLLPALDGGRMTGAASHWKLAVMRPGDRPIHHLATALTPLLKYPDDPSFQVIEPREMLQTMMESSCFGLKEAALGPILNENENLLVVVDQFEELFRFQDTTKDLEQQDEARAFVRLLLEATADPDIPIYVVITMRSDFLGDCPRFRDLPEAINEGQYLVPRLTRNQLRETITCPAAVFNGQFAPDLVIRLLNDIGDNPDQLPILQHALMRTWDHHQDGAEIQVADYEAIGGLENALNQHAEEIHATLAKDGLAPVTEQLFKCLTKMEADGRGIRRPMRLREVCAVANVQTSMVQKVIEAYRAPGCSFLMPPSGVPLTPDTMLDISHESFMRLWLRLGDWVLEEHQSALEYHKLSLATVEYHAGRVNLWRQPELGIALKWQEEVKPTAAWASRYDHNFEPSMRFLSDSHAAWIKEEEDKAAVLLLQQKSATQRKNLRRLLIAVLIMIGLLIFSIFATIYALDQKGIAEEKEAQISLKADSLKTTLDVNDSLLGVTNENLAFMRVLQRETDSLNKLLGLRVDTISSQRNQLDQQVKTVSTQRDTLQLIRDRLAVTNQNLEGANQNLEGQYAEQKRLKGLAEVKSNLLEALQLAARSIEAPDKESAASLASKAYRLYTDNGGPKYDSRIYSALQKALERYEPQIQKELDCYPVAMDYDPQRDFAAVMGLDGTLWELRKVKEKASLVANASLKSNEIKVLRYNGAIGSVVLTNIANEVMIYDVAKAQVGLRIKGHTAQVTAVELLPKKGLLLSCTASGELLKTDAAGKSERSNLLFQGSKSKVTALKASPKEDFIVVAKDKELNLLRLDNMSSVKTLQLTSPATQLAFSSDGSTLAFGLENGVVGFYFPAKDSLSLASAHSAKVSAIRFSPDGNYVASASLDQTLRLWRTDGLDNPPVVLVGHQDWVTGLGFRDDSRVLYSISKDRTLRRWFTRPEDLATALDQFKKSGAGQR